MRNLNLIAGIALLAVVLPAATMGADEGTVFVTERAPRAAAAPYENTEFDRDPPTIAERMKTKGWMIGEAPYEGTLADRSWPYLPQFAEPEMSASAGASAEFGSAWTRDHNFIAPAQ